ncbi:hypothetical protein [Rhodococcus sp. ACT016]|uniref:hypothetical protein n=1 Tax=Rhodococcus sp. ACT016 TaxID=3134808 RepID=UPI003D2BEF6C
MFKFLCSINDHCERPLDRVLLERVFDKNWEDLVTRLAEVPRPAKQTDNSHITEGDREPGRSEKQMLGEILERVRGIERTIRLGDGVTGVRVSRVGSTIGDADSISLDRHFGSGHDHLDDYADRKAKLDSLIADGSGWVSHKKFGLGDIVDLQPEPLCAVVKFDSQPESRMVVDPRTLRSPRSNL